MRIEAVILSGLWLLLLCGTVAAETEIIPDTENCLLCHRYPGMGRYDKTGRKRIFYIPEQMYANSVHAKLRCKNCHVGLDQIPHTDVKKVDCATKCHLKEPSTLQEFSHLNMVKKYEASVHGRGTPNNPKSHPEDLPTCKYCHDNRMYNSLDGLWGKSEALSNETLARCIGCHTQKQWARDFYAHFTHRLRRRRTQAEVIRLCTSCHEDQVKMARHGLESIATYKDTFHWTQVKYGVRNAPDCISCHVPTGYSTHDIRPRTDPVSPIHVLNRIQTCSNQGGVQACHPGATVEFATGRVHAYGTKAQLLAGGEVNHLQDQELSLVRQRAEKDMPQEDVFHFRVLKLVKIFYKVFIAAVITFMFMHQWLDFLRDRRRRLAK